MCRWNEAFWWPSLPQRDVQRSGCSEHCISLLFILEESFVSLTAVAVSHGCQLLSCWPVLCVLDMLLPDLEGLLCWLSVN